MTHGRILVVDDNPDDRLLLARPLRKAGYEVRTADSGQSALDLYTEERFDLCVVDQSMPGMDGLTLLSELRKHDATAQVIIFTGHGSIDRAVAAMRQGAVDFLTKPVEREILLTRIEKALAVDAVMAENRTLRAELERRFDVPNLIAESDASRHVLALAEQAARHDVTVLITGESGVGKEVVARAVHYNSSPRRTGPFFAFNCAAISESLIESELFGHERGAFTGADRRKEGLIEQAARGTLLLDEIGELPLSAQAKLLRVIDNHEMIRVGGTHPTAVSARLIAATNRDLPAQVSAGEFRQDLYFRLNVFSIHVPPLRERREDILPLARYFLRRLTTEMGKDVAGFTPDSCEVLQSSSWPGNVRELANTVERAVIVSRGDWIQPGDFPPTPDFSSEPTPPPVRAAIPDSVGAVKLATWEMERAVLVRALDDATYNVSRAARQLGIGRGALRHRLTKYGLDRKRR